MTSHLGELIFHRQADATRPEAFRFEPQIYRRLEGDVPVAEAEFPWSDELLGLLGQLARDAGDADARLRVGAVLRDFLARLGWRIPEKRLGAGAKGEEPLLLTIRSTAAELYALPWELMTLPIANQHLADLNHVLVRYAWPGLPPLPLAEQEHAGAGTPRAIFAWSAAGGAVPVAEHGAAIEAAAAAARCAGALIEVVPDVTERALVDALAADRTAVLHVLCHGSLGTGVRGGRGALRWRSDREPTEVHDIDPHGLAGLLHRARSRPRLVVLCACYGGHVGPEGLYLGSMAQALHRAGVPAVVASRYPFSCEGSIRVTRVLYKALLADGASLEVALQRVRAALHSPNGQEAPESPGDELGRCSEDAYALQLYAWCTEQVRAEDGSMAERTVRATYPFGRAAPPRRTPVPAAALSLPGSTTPDAPIFEEVQRLVRMRLPRILTACSGEPRPVLIRVGIDTSASRGGSALDQWTYVCDGLATAGLPGIVSTINLVREIQATYFSEELTRWTAEFMCALLGNRARGGGWTEVMSKLKELVAEEAGRWARLALQVHELELSIDAQAHVEAIEAPWSRIAAMVLGRRLQGPGPSSPRLPDSPLGG